MTALPASLSKCLSTLGLAIALAALAPAARAQLGYVDEVTEITADTTAQSLYSYSTTYVPYFICVSYEPGVHATITENGTVVWEDVATGGSSCTAEVYNAGYVSITLGDTYVQTANHSVYTVYSYTGGDNRPHFENPAYFHNIYPDEPFPDEYDYYSDGTGDPDITSWTLEVGMTQVQITASAPSISGIDPDHGVVGQSDTITVNGTNLIDPITGDASPAIDGAGVTISVNGNPSESHVILNYSIDQNAPTGNKTLTLSNRFGTDGATFAVGYPAAHVTSLSPPSWQAGQSFTLTINGTGFGTAPTVAISGAAGVQYGQAMNTNPQGTQTQVPVTVQANAPDATATVTVTPGYVGSSYMCGNCNGGSPDGSNTADVRAIQAPTPSIIRGLYADNQCQGNSITTQSVVVGQLIQFTGCVPSSVADITVNYASWTVNDSAFSDHATAGIQITATSGNYMPIQPVSCTGHHCDYSSGFYFVTKGTYQFTYSYSLSNGTSNSATVTYVVGGPSPTGIGIASGEDGEVDCPATNFICVYDHGTATLATSGSDTWMKYLVAASFDHPFDSMGIIFHIAAEDPENSQTQNPSAYQWVQLLAPSTNTILAAGVPATSSRKVQAAGLDNFYPYPSGDNTPDHGTYSGDGPGVGLTGLTHFNGYTVQALGELQDTFQATMYLLWDPSLNISGTITPGCAASRSYSTGGDAMNTISKASQCSGSIPVPLASITWGYCGTAIQTNQSSPSNQNNGWIMSCGSNDPPTPTYSDRESYSGFPVWFSVVSNTY